MYLVSAPWLEAYSIRLLTGHMHSQVVPYAGRRSTNIARDDDGFALVHSDGIRLILLQTVYSDIHDHQSPQDQRAWKVVPLYLYQCA